MPVRGHLPRDCLQRPCLGRLIEVDQHVAAEYDVEPAERAQIAEQVPLLPLHHGAECVADPPAGVLAVEIPHQHLHRQAALDFELGVEPLRARAPAGRGRCRCRRSPSAGRPQRRGSPSGSSPANTLPARTMRRPTRCAAARRPAARRSRRGRACVRKCSNGLSSRKKKLSLVVIASTTSRASASASRGRAAAPPARRGRAGPRASDRASRVSSR